MLETTILLVDNDKDFRETRAKFLENVGYRIIQADSRDSALEALKLHKIDLAVLDIRLRDDDDEKDVIGMILAEEMPASLPKIIMTAFPTAEAVARLLSVRPDRIPPAMDYIAKIDGPEALIVSVSRIVGTIRMSLSRSADTSEPRAGENKGVFIVHGHDEAAKQGVARFLEKVGVDVIILSEQVSRSRTIMEMLESCANANFAVVLLTPDDVGHEKDKRPRMPQYRARQNVLFELGFFMGSLGRSRVCCLYVEGVELLSDFYGVVYISLDSHGGWKVKLARELEGVGYLIDPEKLKVAL